MTHNYNVNILETEAKGIWIWSQPGLHSSPCLKNKSKTPNKSMPQPPPQKKTPQRFQYFPWPVHSFQIPLLGSWHHLPSHSRKRLRNLPRLSLPYCTIEVETRSVLPSLSVSTLIHVASFLLQTRGGFSNLLLLDLSLPLPGAPNCPLGNLLSLIWWLSM